MKHSSTHTQLFPRLHRLFVLLILMFLVTGTKAQLLKQLEYFFDKDPGTGKGVAIPVSPSSSLDTVLRLPVNGITDGLHTLYLRAQDTAGVWSLYHSASFIKYQGSDSVLDITAIEYFFDQDPGFGKATSLQLTPSANISNLFNITVPDNGNDTRVLYIRAKDRYGRWSLLHDISIDMCSLYKARPDFGFIRYGSVYTFIDSTLTNTSGKLVWKYDGNASDTIKSPSHSFGLGKHTVKLVAGSGCRADSVSKALYTALENYSPKKVMTGGHITMDFYGGGLDKDVVVTLIDSAGNTLPAVSKNADKDQSHYTAVFDLFKTTLSSETKWNIRLQLPNAGYDTTILQGLSVTPKPADSLLAEPVVTVGINMPRITGSNTWHRGSFLLTNTGLITARLVPFNFSVDDQLQAFRLDNLQIASDASVFSSAVMDSIALFEHLPVIFGDARPCKVYGIVIPELAPGQSITIPYEFLTPAGLSAQIHTYAWTGKHMLDTAMRQAWVNTISDATIRETGRNRSLVNANLVDCGSATLGKIHTLLTADPQLNLNRNIASFGVSTGTMLFKCIGINAFDSIRNIISRIKYAGMASGVNAALTTASGNNNNGRIWNDYWYSGTSNLASLDPNEITGPAGWDSTRHYLNAGTSLAYQVHFENKDNAARAAQRVIVKDTLDGSKMDIPSFSWQHFTIADSVFPVPSFRNEYTTTVDLSAKRNVRVRFNAKLDTVTRILTAEFISLHPITGEILTDTVLAGFLPPNTDKLSGTGSIAYSINQRNGNKTGDSVTNRASIVFDNNAPILTNTWLNIIDTTRPSGKIAGASLQNDSVFTVYVSGQDNESGIKNYSVYASVNKGPYFLLSQHVRDSLRISGSKDSSYNLYAVPLDNVNNTQLKTAAADITISLFTVAAIKGDSAVCAGSSSVFTSTTQGGTWESSNKAIAEVSASGIVTGIASGTVTITYTVKQDYFSRSVTKTIRIKPLPPKTGFSTTARTFCNKDSLTVGITGLQTRDSLFWYTGTTIDSSQKTSRTFKDSALVTVLRKDSTGCGIFSDTIQLVRIVVPVPTITQRSDSLISSAAMGNQWYLNNALITGATDQQYKIRNSGTYHVTAADANGCRSALSAAFAVTLTAISNITVNSKEWQVFPNPVVNGILYIRRSGISNGPVQAQITTTEGKTVGEKKISQQTQWDVHHLPAGMYVLRIMEKNSVSVYPFIKL
jgi:hypothetical protein